MKKSCDLCHRALFATSRKVARISTLPQQRSLVSTSAVSALRASSDATKPRHVQPLPGISRTLPNQVPEVSQVSHDHSAVLRQRSRLKVARCPLSFDNDLKSHPCKHCSKEFAFTRARDLHEAKHRLFKCVCQYCRKPLSDEGVRKRHEQRHYARPAHICPTCGDEFVLRSDLNEHEEKEAHDHLSKSQTPVNGSSLHHVTDKASAEKIVSKKSFEGSSAFRSHDAVLRRDDAPKVSFFTAGDIIHSSSPHPVMAEPGELASALILSLDAFLRNDGEFRLYLVGSTSTSGHLYDQAALRTTLLFAREEQWQWCEERNLIELDIHDNSLLQTARLDDGSNVWHVASHVLLPEFGLRPLRVAVAVAGDTFDTSAENVRSVDIARLFQEDSKVFCPTCGESFSHRMKLFHHLDVFEVEDEDDMSITTPGSSLFVCPVEECQRPFAEQSSLTQHIRGVHAGNEAKVFSCDFDDCSYTTNNKSNLYQHQLVHSGKSQEGRSTRAEMASLESTDERPHVCSRCGKGFKRVTNLREHERWHAMNRYACRADPACTKRFKTTGDRSRHELRHLDVRMHVCRIPKCDKSFKTKDDLVSHERVHTRDLKYVCEEPGCTYATWRMDHLRRHAYVHSDERPHVCSVCAQAFKSPYALKAHSSAHSDLRPFACAQCGKTFKTAGNLHTHELRHLDYRLYRCRVDAACDKAFNTSSDRSNHERLKHAQVNASLTA